MWMEEGLESWPGEVLTNIPTLCDFNDATVTFAMYPISMRLLQPIIAHCVIKLILWLETWRGIQQIARNALSIFFQKTCISNVKYSLTNLQHLVSFMQTTKNSSKTWSFWLRINFCEKSNLQECRNNNKDWETHFNFGNDIDQLDTRTHFPLRS